MIQMNLTVSFASLFSYSCSCSYCTQGQKIHIAPSSLLPQSSESGDRCNRHHEGQSQQGAGQRREAGGPRGKVR